MPLKSSYLSASTRHLYEFAEEIGNLGSAIDEAERTDGRSGEIAP